MNNNLYVSIPYTTFEKSGVSILIFFFFF